MREQYCALCNRPAVDGLTHPGCQKAFGLDGLLSVAYYSGPIARLVTSLKYRRLRDLKTVLAKLFRSYLFTGEDYYPSDTIVAPVPLHFLRENERGFNQAEILAKIVSDIFSFGFYANLLERIRFTPSQTALTREDRRENIRGAFQINPKLQSLISNLQSSNSSILLIDDVWTTGATLKECARVLKERGVSRVYALTLARDY